MLPLTRLWSDGLRRFAAGRRRGAGLAASHAGPARAAEQTILSGWLARWVATLPDIMAARRRQLVEIPPPSPADPDAAIVLTTSTVGLSVAGELFATCRLDGEAIADRIVAVTELEYRLWCIRNPDGSHLLHVNAWNWIKTGVPRRRHGEFARHPLADGEDYWLHRTGVAGAGAADRRDCDLWKWDGGVATLLEGRVVERSTRGLV